MYYVVYGLLWLVSLLPLRVLYLISDFFFWLAYHVIGYRKDVVMSNLAIAFPEKSIAERKKIAAKFYHNLIDTFIETIKMISAPYSFISKRWTVNWEVINQYYESGQSVQVHLGHNFNWEWGNAVMGRNVKYKTIVVYMPIANKTLDKLFFRLRSRTGVVLIPATDMRRSFMPFRGTQYLLGLAADQNPGYPGNAWWINFFGRPTPFVKGPAKAAIANQTKVVFTFIHKLRRGYYEAVISEPDIDIKNITEEELTICFVRYLENVIRTYPDMWLWSHRRWKWNYDPSYGEILKG